MNDIVDRLRAMERLYDAGRQTDILREAADEIERLREVLRAITDHFADVMDGPMIRGAGVEFKNGVEGIPTIAKARALLKEMEP